MLPPAQPAEQVPDISDAAVQAALIEIKREARARRIALVAPVVLAMAVLGAFAAAPPQHGGLALVPEADASDDTRLPWVFGANGVWRLAEPIEEAAAAAATAGGVGAGPAWQIDLPVEPSSPDFVLSAPSQNAPAGDPANQSLSASASSPPTPTLRQSAEVDWSDFRPPIRVETVTEDSAPTELIAPVDSDEPDDSDEPGDGVDTADTPAASVPAEADATTPDSSSNPDEDVTTGDVANATASAVGDPFEVNPSTPQPDPVDQGAQPPSVVATIVPRSVLVHRAHVSVTVQVVDDDSSVIDWCRTRVDWGDGSVTGLVGPDGVAGCAAQCEHRASSSAIDSNDSGDAADSADLSDAAARLGFGGVGIDQELVFTHEYSMVIDAAPRIYVATGDGCSYDLAEFQLVPFTVVPY